MILLVGYYEDSSAARRQEFLTCLLRNLANDRISEVRVFLEDTGEVARAAASRAELHHPKLRMIEYGRRLTYRELFDHANRHLIGKRVIIANADIYFDHTLTRLDDVKLTGKLACLSRWDVLEDGGISFFDHHSSQDAWVFDVPILPLACDFRLGMLGCDNRLAWEARAAGLEVFNPSRSVHACHLHRSQVRRYNRDEQVVGPLLPVPACALDTPWLSFIVPYIECTGDATRSIGSLVKQPRSSCFVVARDCHDGTQERLHTEFPTVTVVKAPESERCSLAEVLNRGEQATDEHAILCFLEPALQLAPDFVERILAALPINGFLIDRDRSSLCDGLVVCRKHDFARVGGFDDLFLDPGQVISELGDRLTGAGLVEARIPQNLVSYRDVVASTLRGWVLGDAATSSSIQHAYRRAKAAILKETGGSSPPKTALRHIYWTIAAVGLRKHGLAPNLTLAHVAFHEEMGYVLSQLNEGVSSHTNESRPFVQVPTPLLGKPFTQVVANQVSPVEIEFLTEGKLYVLVGADWHGHRPATEWLTSQGYREPLPPVTTGAGTAFEVWSVIGVAGTRLCIPTQVMLVADCLQKRS